MNLALALLMYTAFAVFVVGLGWKIALWLRAPARLNIPVTPAPRSHAGVVWRIANEALVFRSLFASNKWLWLFGWLFHVSLAVLVLRHLRYFMEPVPVWVRFFEPLGVPGAIAMLLSLFALSLRRLALPRVRYVTTASDQLMLALLGLIAISGGVMQLARHTDIVSLKRFILGLYRFEMSPLPPDAPLILHLLLVALLLALFPASKLLHAPGVFFSPSRAQRDAGRERPATSPGA